MVLPFVLRRMKEEVLQDLPPKVVQDYICTMTPLQVRHLSLWVLLFNWRWSNVFIFSPPPLLVQTLRHLHKH